MLRGLPASGKSTWAKEQVRQGVHRVSKDDLRMMLDNGAYSKPNEKIIIEVRNLIVQRVLFYRETIIVDDTNFNPIHEKTLREIANIQGAAFEVKDFEASLEDCIARDAERGEKSVGEKVIREMYEENLKRRTTVTDPIQQNTSLPGAFICDLDGTVALLDGRSPYDASACVNDRVNSAVASVVNTLAASLPLIFVSGREDKYRAQTEEWLSKYNFKYKDLIMRKSGDSRKDSIIKREILETQILPNYYVHCVFDDRNQVVDMWRSLGLTCFQVAPGDF